VTQMSIHKIFDPLFVHTYMSLGESIFDNCTILCKLNEAIMLFLCHACSLVRNELSINEKDLQVYKGILNIIIYNSYTVIDYFISSIFINVPVQ